MEVQLSRGAVAAIWEDPPAVSAAAVPLVLQVLDLRPWPGAAGSGLHTMLLSDGDHIICGALPPDMSASPAASSIGKGAVVRFPDFEFKVSMRKRLIIPKELEVLQTECATVGNPKPYQPAHWESKHEELNPQLASSSSGLNTGAYSAEQGLGQLLTRGVVVMFHQPVMQVVSVMRSGHGEHEKFHVVLSDGVHTQNATLSPHLNHLVKNSQLRMGTIVRLLKFICNTIQSPSSVSVDELEVLQTDCELIGRPKAYELCSIGEPYGLQIKCGEPFHGPVPNYAQPDNASNSSGQGLKWRFLTQGAVMAMLEGKMAVEQQPIMQVVDISRVSKCERTLYVVLLSDGVYQEHALLYEDTNSLVECSWLCNGSIVRILKFFCDNRMNCRVFFVSLVVVEMQWELIGSPRFHELGLTHKEKELYVAASVPVLPEENYFMDLFPSEDASKWSGQSHPWYCKSMPD